MTKTNRKTPARQIPIRLIKASEWNAWVAKQDTALREWARVSNFTAKASTHCVVPDKSGTIARVLVGATEPLHLWSLAFLPDALPTGEYRLETHTDSRTSDQLMLGWLLACYHFTRYKKQAKKYPTLQPPTGCNIAKAQQMADAICFARDLINTPANDLGPGELATAARVLAQKEKAEYREIIGEGLLKENYPAIYEVGKASSRAPRLIDIRWGDKRHPKVTLVGKGVCFDSGGLDIKPSSGMKLMKKDMGGAAVVLALAQLIMKQNLPVRLRVLVPAVENSISGNAYRPSDVIATRRGISVEVGNTDAEGRLVLCDALAEAVDEKPDLLIDCATLTGAARTALGTDMPALFTPDDSLAQDLLRHSKATSDPLWRLPLWSDYRDMLNSQIADINSAPDSGYAGAITAALYLKEFVPDMTRWAHIDMMAWNLTKRPGRPQGGEAMAVRALFAYINEHYSSH